MLTQEERKELMEEAKKYWLSLKESGKLGESMGETKQELKVNIEEQTKEVEHHQISENIVNSC